MVDIIENISKDVKWAQFRKKMDTLRDEPAMPPRFESAERSKSLFLKSYEEGDEELDEKEVSYYQAPIDIKYTGEMGGRWQEGRREEVEVVVSLIVLPLVIA